MDLKKGLNRVFVLLAIAASLFGFVLGGESAYIAWKPLPEEAFHSFSWSKENINKYYMAAKEGAEAETKKELIQRRMPWEDRIFPKIEELQNYKKSPPQYDYYVFATAFPEALEAPAYKIWIYGKILGALLAFCFCYGGLHLIFFVVKWIVNGFKDK